MEKNWFECKVAIERTMENGMVKKMVEAYLVEAMNFTEAEQRIIEQVSPYFSGDFDVTSVMRRHFAEIFETADSSADRWYKAKLIFITLDEKTGAEKKSSHLVLIQAANFHDALKRLDEGMKDSMMDYTVAAMNETPYMDLYKSEELGVNGEK